MSKAKKKSIYMMGICGTAMGSLAGLLKSMGHEVRGSDQNVYPPMSTRLASLGIPVVEGYRPSNLEPHPDLVIVGNVMSRNNPEVQALLQTDIVYTSLPQAMGEWVIGDRHSVCISGTHGKTTTTALAAWVLTEGGLEPGFMIGGVPLNFPQTFSLGSKSDYFVIEGDEYDTAFFDKVPKFVHYKPRSVILTSVEFDHADIYKDLNDVKNAFRKLLQIIPANGNLIYRAEDQNIQSLLEETSCKNVESYGAQEGDWRLGDIDWGERSSKFEVVYKEKKVDTIETQLFGDYNLLNALSVYALATRLKIPAEKIKLGLETFKGVKRRQEIIGKPNDIVVIDDFAHHPTAVRVTIEGVRARFSKSKIIAVFEPRSATSRRKIFQSDFARALGLADQIVVSEPYDQSKIDETDRFDSTELTQEITKLFPGKSARVEKNSDGIVKFLKEEARPGNVILLMSNGGFGGIYDKILSTLS